MQRRRLVLVVLFAPGLVFIGPLGNAAFHDGIPTPYSGYATSLYIGLTIAFAVMLVRSWVNLHRPAFARGA